MILTGGIKHEDEDWMVATNDLPNLTEPQGTHGTLQMPAISDGEAIKAEIRSRFAVQPRTSFGGDIRFVAHPNADGTMEVNFEVVG